VYSHSLVLVQHVNYGGGQHCQAIL
jgi:hypothetical protein